MSPRLWRIGPSASVTLDRPRLMAILNITPDSFAEIGRFDSPDQVGMAAVQAVRDGADMLDVGGESTRPGAARVIPEEQIRRVVPAIRAIRSAVGREVPITIDTTHAAVAEAALGAGANAVNDVSAGMEDPAMLPLAAKCGCGIILMHRLRSPEEDSYSDRYEAPPRYEDVVGEVGAFLRIRADAAIQAGISADSIVLDPGLGFGKTVEQNMALIAGTGRLAEMGFPILSGLSRKSFTGAAAGLGPGSSPADRLPATLALSVTHRACGASIFRVHDVRPHREALAAAEAAQEGRRG